RAHLLEGLGIALANIDPVIALIKGSTSPAEAKEKLVAKVWQPGAVVQMLERAGADASRPEDLPENYGLSAEGYRLSPVQAQAILDLRLHRLTGLEQEKIFEEFQQLLTDIAGYLQILQNPDQLMQVIRNEMLEIKQQFGDQRRSEIIDAQVDLTNEDLI